MKSSYQTTNNCDIIISEQNTKHSKRRYDKVQKLLADWPRYITTLPAAAADEQISNEKSTDTICLTPCLLTYEYALDTIITIPAELHIDRNKNIVICTALCHIQNNISNAVAGVICGNIKPKEGEAQVKKIDKNIFRIRASFDIHNFNYNNLRIVLLLYNDTNKLEI